MFHFILIFPFLDILQTSWNLNPLTGASFALENNPDSTSYYAFNQNQIGKKNYCIDNVDFEYHKIILVYF